MRFKYICFILVVLMIMQLSFNSINLISVQALEDGLKLIDSSLDQDKYIDNYSNAKNVKEKIVINSENVISEISDKTNLNFLGENDYIDFQVDIKTEGLYELEFCYLPLKGNVRDIELSLELNGVVPFVQAQSFFLPRIWKDEKSEFEKDINGNEFSGEQIEIGEYINSFVVLKNVSSDNYLKLYFNKGTNVLRLYSIMEPFLLKSITIGCRNEPISYQQYISKFDKTMVYDEETLKIELEKGAIKSLRSLTASADVANPKTSPNFPNITSINMIGNNWSKAGQWLEWNINVPKEGLYSLFFRYRQNVVKGFATNRRLYVNGVVPFKEADCIGFPYSGDWDGKYLTVLDNENALIFLKKGTNKIRLEVVQGKLGTTIDNLIKALYDLENIYRKIIMVTGTTPDMFRDYNLFKEIPDLKSKFEELSSLLKSEYINIKEINQNASKEAEILNLLSFQIDNMVESPNKIPIRLNNFNGNIVGFAAFALNIRFQPLELDYLCLFDGNKKVENFKANFFDVIGFEFSKFFYSFIRNYNTINESNDTKTITMWLGIGRDQAQVISKMTNDMFTTKTGINVNIKLVSASMVEAFISNQSPDMAIMLGRSMPVNLAARGALVDLTKFDDFYEHLKSFAPQSIVPFTLNDGVYGVPDQQLFFMMFYRKDIFSELNLSPPKTWKEFYNAISIIQRHKMTVGVPYVALDAWGAVDAGMGAKSIFPALVLQNGGKFYQDDLKSTALNMLATQSAFKQWTELYTDYGIPITYDFYNRFRMGEIPLAIAPYNQYYLLEAAAPEINGLWEMTTIPGVENPDKTINAIQAGASTACVILSKCKKQAEAWEFIKWWTSATVQAKYSLEVESILGVLGRQAVANIDALQLMSWNKKEIAELKNQLETIVEIPEIPGSYYMVRGIDNAFKEVVYNKKNYIEALNIWNIQINREINKKREELLNAKSK